MAGIASACARPCGPRPKTSRRRAPGAASRRTASALTAAVRSVVSAMPSITAAGARVSGSNTTHTPWIRGSPPTVTSLTAAAAPPAPDGMISSSPPPMATLLRGGSPSGSRPPRSAASSASAAATTSRAAATSSAERNGSARGIARESRASALGDAGVDVDAAGEPPGAPLGHLLVDAGPHVQLDLLGHPQAVVQRVGDGIARRGPRLDAEGDHAGLLIGGAPLDLARLEVPLERG